jgi:hypothetical protein
MKICCTCHQEKQLEDFNLHRGNEDGRQDRCRDCQKAWYKLNGEQHRKNTAVRNKILRERNRIYVYDYISQHPCVDCGESDPPTLDFDHVRGEKKYNISKMIYESHSIESIDAEIAKCEVRCANCHRRKTAKQFNWYFWREAA